MKLINRYTIVISFTLCALILFGGLKGTELHNDGLGLNEAFLEYYNDIEKSVVNEDNYILKFITICFCIVPTIGIFFGYIIPIRLFWNIIFYLIIIIHISLGMYETYKIMKSSHKK